MSDRINQLEKNQLVERVRNIQRTIEELKNRQSIGGASLKVRLNQSANALDINDTIPEFFNGRWRITFTPDNVAKPFAEIQANITIPNDPFGFGREADADLFPDPFNISTGNNVVYLMEVKNYSYGSTTLVQAKFAIKSADTGTISVTRLANY